MDENRDLLGKNFSFEDLAKKYVDDNADTTTTVNEQDTVATNTPSGILPLVLPVQTKMQKVISNEPKVENILSNNAPAKKEYLDISSNAIGDEKTVEKIDPIPFSAFMSPMNDSDVAPVQPDEKLENYRAHRAKRRDYLKKTKGKVKQRFDSSKFTKSTYTFFAVVISIAVVLSVYAVFCVNDILAISKSKTPVSVPVAVSDVSDVNSVINLLHDYKLVNCPLFCKAFVQLRSSVFVKTSKGTPIEYTQGSFELTPKMGLEGLLITLQGDIAEKEIVELMFPEGYTIPEIVAKLAKYKVCDEAAMIAELQRAEFSYSLVNGLTTKDEIPFKLEGYLFPATYEFYEGESPNSVIDKFVKTMDARFTQEMRQSAANQNLTISQVLTIASIIQMEAANESQMKVISSILRNRLNNPQLQPLLQCNSTSDYITNKVAKTLTVNSAHTADYYELYYNTYSMRGLPPGPICNPSLDAINAALAPAKTDLFYFCHDKKRNMYTAKTLAEHDRNVANHLS